jgi:hypothetical protein
LKILHQRLTAAIDFSTTFTKLLTPPDLQKTAQLKREMRLKLSKTDRADDEEHETSYPKLQGPVKFDTYRI